MSKGRHKYERTDFTDLFNSINGNTQPVEDKVMQIPDEEKTKKDIVISDSLQRELSNEKIKYLCDSQNEMLHDKSCRWAWEIPEEYRLSVEEFDTDYSLCHKCKTKALIRAGAKDIKEFEKYMELFSMFGIDNETLYKMYIKYGFKTKLSTMNKKDSPYSNWEYNAITIRCNEDSWRIGIVDKGSIRLEHNNYKQLKMGEREFTPGFHVQNDYSYEGAIKEIVRYIGGYRYEDHFYMPINPDATSKRPPLLVTMKERLCKKKEETLWLRIRKTLFKKYYHDRINALRASNIYPESGALCLYLWKNDNGKISWNTGIYRKKKKYFMANYGDSKVIVPFEKVIKWAPVNEISVNL